MKVPGGIQTIPAGAVVGGFANAAKGNRKANSKLRNIDILYWSSLKDRKNRKENKGKLLFVSLCLSL
jgi:hypothetical protein